MEILLVILLIWNIILTVDIRKLEKKLDVTIKLAGDTLDNHDKQLEYLQEKVKEKDTLWKRYWTAL